MLAAEIIGMRLILQAHLHLIVVLRLYNYLGILHGHGGAICIVNRCFQTCDKSLINVRNGTVCKRCKRMVHRLQVATTPEPAAAAAMGLAKCP